MAGEPRFGARRRGVGRVRVCGGRGLRRARGRRRGALAGVRWVQVAGWPGSGRWRRWRRPWRTLAMDRAPSSGAAVIWSMTAWRSCPASWAARSAAWSALRECSRWYRRASVSVSRAVICWSISACMAGRTAAVQRLSRCPVPPAHSWDCRMASVADSSPASRSMTFLSTASGVACW